MKRAPSRLAIDQQRSAKARRSSQHALRGLENDETIIDQMVRHTASLNAYPPGFTVHQAKSFTLEIEIYPDFGSVQLTKRPHLHKSGEQQDMLLEVKELETFADGVAELVAIARERGWLST